MKAAFLSLVMLLAGCATQPVAPAAGESIDGLRSERIAVAYTLAEKRLHAQETLFRGVFLQYKTSSLDFSGFWNADVDLSSTLAAQLREQGFAADSLYQVVDKALAESSTRAWNKQLVIASTATHPSLPSAKLVPARDFFFAAPRQDGLSPLVSALREKGYRYLVQLSATGIWAAAPGFGLVAVGAEPYAQVIDLRIGKVIWGFPLVHNDARQLGGDLKALEVDEMKVTKDAMAAGIRKIDFRRLWGFPSNK